MTNRFRLEGIDTIANKPTIFGRAAFQSLLALY